MLMGVEQILADQLTKRQPVKLDKGQLRISDMFKENELSVEEIGDGKIVEIYAADIVARNRKLLEQRRA